MNILVRRLLGAFLAAATALAAACALTTAPAQAAGMGKACVFVQPQGASGNGHVGWGFRVSQEDHWFFGSTENTQGAATIDAGNDIGFWEHEGTYDQMLDAFVRQTYYPRDHRAYPAWAYTAFKCEDVSDSAVNAAKAEMAATARQGYRLIGNNCMNHAYNILKAYNTKNLPDPAAVTNWAPNNWYANLGDEWSEYRLPAETWASPVTGKYADIEGPSTDNGAVLHQWSWTGGDNQWWWRIDAGGGYYKVVSRHSDKCLDVAGPSRDAGATVHQWECYDTDSQLWRWEPTGDSYYGSPLYRIVNKYSGKCLGLLPGETADGAQILQLTCNSGAEQRWW
jgi:hypothetical protein